MSKFSAIPPRLPAPRFFPPAKCPEQRHFFRPRTASIRGSIDFPIKNPLREKKIPEWKWGRSVGACSPEIDLPPFSGSCALWSSEVLSLETRANFWPHPSYVRFTPISRHKINARAGRNGVKLGSLPARTAFPFCPQEQTSSGCALWSGSCHELTLRIKSLPASTSEIHGLRPDA